MLKVGKISSVNGLQGTLVLRHIFDDSTWLKQGDVLFVELRLNSFIPYFVQSVNAANQQDYLITLDDVDSAEEAKKLVNKTVYVKEDVLEQAEVDSPLMYIGFNLVDKTTGGLGEIEDVMLIGKQWIARLTIEGKEVLVPLVDEMILDVNKKNKFIRMDLPHGLLQVYLGDEEEEDED